jgi:hypothetical protein
VLQRVLFRCGSLDEPHGPGSIVPTSVNNLADGHT